MRKNYTGYTEKTKENLVLDSGAFYKNFDVGTDTVESAKAKLIGATQDGGQFIAKATYREVEVDGMRAAVKGMEFIDKWEVNLSCSTIECTLDNLKLALGSAVVTTDANNDVITGALDVSDADYLENITFVGCLSGSEKPIVIQVYNALCVDGLTVDTKDKDHVKLSLNFKGHSESGEVPFKIHYPKAQ